MSHPTLSGAYSTLLTVCPEIPASRLNAAQVIFRILFLARVSFLIQSLFIVTPAPAWLQVRLAPVLLRALPAQPRRPGCAVAPKRPLCARH